MLPQSHCSTLTYSQSVTRFLPVTMDTLLIAVAYVSTEQNTPTAQRRHGPTCTANPAHTRTHPGYTPHTATHSTPDLSQQLTPSCTYICETFFQVTKTLQAQALLGRSLYTKSRLSPTPAHTNRYKHRHRRCPHSHKCHLLVHHTNPHIADSQPATGVCWPTLKPVATHCRSSCRRPRCVAPSCHPTHRHSTALPPHTQAQRRPASLHTGTAPPHGVPPHSFLLRRLRLERRPVSDTGLVSFFFS
jgi:hypothetical protein